MAKAPMTQAGFDKLVAEHSNYFKVELPAIIEKVAEARANGDLKENAEYHAAREKQGYIQDKIKYLEDTIGSAQIVQVNANADCIVFGSTVTIIDLEDDEEEEFTLVGADEADASKGFISVTSPIGEGLLGKTAGDIAKIETPGGTIELKIESFK